MRYNNVTVSSQLLSGILLARWIGRFMSDSPTFRVWLKRRRIERGLTQEDLGERIGYAAQTIRKIEGGQRRPSLQLALRLAQELELSPEEQAAWMNAARAIAEPDEQAPAPQPLRTPMPSQGLPTYLTPFVGRAQEHAELVALLTRPDCRLVTLLGQGGVGKTRLAIETARTIGGFTDGAAFVALAPVAAPALIVSALGEALGFTFTGSGDLLTQLITHLRERRVLLVLDNLEHLLDSSGVTLDMLERLLTQAATVSVLATSRERLRLAGEWVLELEGLTVPQANRRGHTNTAPAISLFVEHAHRIDRTFRLSPENETAITTICRMVDGLPLGIELAAAWTRLLSLDEIAQELSRGLDAAHLSPRTLPARHHSLRAVVEHSWLLLSEQERVVLRQLSVFQGGFTREAAAQVAGASLPTLANLVDKSLLRRGANGRYDLHEIIRQYADAQLQEHADEQDAAREQHATYFLRFVSERERRLKGSEQGIAMAEIGGEIDNIRAAMPWAAAHDLFDGLERAGEVLHWFYEFRSWLQEGSELFANAVEQLRSAGTRGDDDARRRTLGRILGHYGYLSMRFGAFSIARAVLAESYGLLAGVHDSLGLLRTIVSQTQLAYWTGNYGEARRLLDPCFELVDVTGDRHLRAMTETVASEVAHALGLYSEAEQLFHAALANWRALGNPRGMVWCIGTCSVTLLKLGKHHEAQQLLRESLALSYANQDTGGAAMSLYTLGHVAFDQAEVEEAIYFYREAAPLVRTESGWRYAQILNMLAAAQRQVGAKLEARQTYREALSTAMQAQAHHEALQAMIGLAAHFSDTGQYAAAFALASRVLAETDRDELQHRAVELQQAARAQLPDHEAEQIAQHASTQPLATFLAEYVTP